jgi:ribosomal protein L22
MYTKILSKGISDIERLKYIKELSESNKTHPTTVLILAIGCIKSKIWGEASKYIQQIPEGINKRFLHAALTKAEKDDMDTANLLIKEVLTKAAHTPYK